MGMYVLMYFLNTNMNNRNLSITPHLTVILHCFYVNYPDQIQKLFIKKWYGTFQHVGMLQCYNSVVNMVGQVQHGH